MEAPAFTVARYHGGIRISGCIISTFSTVVEFMKERVASVTNLFPIFRICCQSASPSSPMLSPSFEPIPIPFPNQAPAKGVSSSPKYALPLLLLHLLYLLKICPASIPDNDHFLSAIRNRYHSILSQILLLLHCKR